MTIRKLLIPVLAAAVLGGCASYGYRGGGGDYYYGQPSVDYRYYGAPYGSIGYGTGGWYGGAGYGYGYGYPYYGYPGYGYPGYGYYPRPPQGGHYPRPPQQNPGTLNEQWEQQRQRLGNRKQVGPGVQQPVTAEAQVYRQAPQRVLVRPERSESTLRRDDSGFRREMPRSSNESLRDSVPSRSKKP